jgi:RNA polymerase sigma-70 factor (ECF subfamily)
MGMRNDLPSPIDPVPMPVSQHHLQVQQLFVRHQAVVLAYVLSLEPNLADAQDIVQEVFLTISRKADTFTVGSNFPAWACTVARYQTLGFQRRRARQACTLDEDVIALLEDGRTIDGPQFEEEVSVLKGCLLKLAPRARELIWARYHRQRMPEDIADEIGWTANAVRVALSRARTLLRECLNSRIADHAAKEAR